MTDQPNGAGDGRQAVAAASRVARDRARASNGDGSAGRGPRRRSSRGSLLLTTLLVCAVIIGVLVVMMKLAP